MKFVLIFLLQFAYSAWWTSKSTQKQALVPAPAKNVIQRYQNAASKMHVYDYAGNKPTFLNSAIAIAIDPNHYVTPLVNISEGNVHDKLRIFLERKQGMEEVYIKLVDVLTGFVLLYSEDGTPDYITTSDLVSSNPIANEKFTLLTDPTINIGNVEFTYKGKNESSVRNFHTVQSSLSAIESKIRGSLAINNAGKIKGIIHGSQSSKNGFDFSPNLAFLYLYEKSRQPPPDSFADIEAQIIKQSQTLQRRVAAVILNTSQGSQLTIDRWQVGVNEGIMQCKKDPQYNDRLDCELKPTARVENVQPSSNIHLIMRSVTGDNASQLSSIVNDEAAPFAENMTGKKLCSQRRIFNTDSGDTQVHFCTEKIGRNKGMFHTVFRTAYLPKRNVAGVLTLELDGYDQDETKRLIQHFSNVVKRGK